MRKGLFAVRPSELRDTRAGFLTLLAFIASHTLMETARDALFLAKVPASRLPWVYLIIAAVSLLLAQVQARLSRLFSGRRGLCAWILLAALGTLAFWAFLGPLGSAGVYGLYIWSGVLALVVLSHFWTLLGDLFSVTQAKRTFGAIGTGSVLGAIVGSGAASALGRLVPPPQLLLCAAGGFVLTSALPLLFSAGARPTQGVTPDPTESPPGLANGARSVIRQPYARRVGLLLILSATTLTVADYLFKSAVAARVPHADLGSFLGTVYLALNLLSLLSQLTVVRWLLKRFDLVTALSVLPALLLLGGLGAALGGGLAAALAIKGSDGMLRYSLHRTSTELLFVPLSEEARRRIKAFLDVVGQRGGQALASVGLLMVTAVEAPAWALAMALTALGLAWLATAQSLRPHYLDIFRRHVREGHFQSSSGFPELDVASLETLIAALDSSSDEEVLAALDVLERERKARLVPGLILYHPNEQVVLRAFALFTRAGIAGRKNIVAMIDRLFEHPSPRVRTAAISARATLAPDARLLNVRYIVDESPEVRATILVHLIASGELHGADADERIESLLQRGSAGTRAALAEVIGLREVWRFGHVLIRLARAPEVEVRLAATAAMARLRGPEMLPVLLDLLGDDPTCAAAREALVCYGEAAQQPLAEALLDPTLDRSIRLELPKVIALLEPQPAAATLLAVIPGERDGMVRYRSLRSLEGLVARNPGLPLDRRTLERAIDATVSRAYRYLDRRLTLARGAAEAGRATQGHDLLVTLLRDKEALAVERLFRLLGLMRPTDDFPGIHRGLRSPSRELRASSVELIENLLEPPLRGAVLGLTDEIPDEERLNAAGHYHTPAQLDYEALLERMLASESEALQDITVFHIGELGLTRFHDRIEALLMSSDVGGAGGQTRVRSDVERTLALLSAASREQEAC